MRRLNRLLSGQLTYLENRCVSLLSIKAALPKLCHSSEYRELFIGHLRWVEHIVLHVVLEAHCCTRLPEDRALGNVERG